MADAVELGYTVFPPFRARGFATEAVIGLIGWAHRSAGIDNFVVSIAPDNEPSRAIAARLGFRRVGEHTDEFDGFEEVFLLDGAAAQAAFALTAGATPRPGCRNLTTAAADAPTRAQGPRHNAPKHSARSPSCTAWQSA